LRRGGPKVAINGKSQGDVEMGLWRWRIRTGARKVCAHEW